MNYEFQIFWAGGKTQADKARQKRKTLTGSVSLHHSYEQIIFNIHLHVTDDDIHNASE